MQQRSLRAPHRSILLITNVTAARTMTTALSVNEMPMQLHDEHKNQNRIWSGRSLPCGYRTRRTTTRARLTNTVEVRISGSLAEKHGLM
jgi:hypothetical protein